MLALAMAALNACASAPTRDRLYVLTPPPAQRVEVVGAAPGPGYVWVRGYYRWVGDGYAWVPGHWVVPVRGYHRWVPGYWAHDRRGWYRVEGHWG
jgi:hypothetical protein